MLWPIEEWKQFARDPSIQYLQVSFHYRKEDNDEVDGEKLGTGDEGEAGNEVEEESDTDDEKCFFFDVKAEIDPEKLKVGF